MAYLRAHRFSLCSLGISVGGFLVVFVGVVYFRHEGTWAPHTTPYRTITAAGGLCLLLSFGSALVALVKERSKLAVLALLVSISNFFLYAR